MDWQVLNAFSQISPTPPPASTARSPVRCLQENFDKHLNSFLQENTSTRPPPENFSHRPTNSLPAKNYAPATASPCASILCTRSRNLPLPANIHASCPTARLPHHLLPAPPARRISNTSAKDGHRPSLPESHHLTSNKSPPARCAPP